MTPLALIRQVRLGSVRRSLGQDELLKLFRPGSRGQCDYSLKPFLTTNSLFVHVPRTGGVSISRALYGCLGLGHLTLAEHRELFRARTFANMFKFTFVRNPFDRIHSAYCFLRANGMGGLDAEFNQRVLEPFHSFERFVLEGLDRNEVRSFWHFLPDTHFLSLKPGDALGLDFVGRYERLDRDFDFVRRRVNPAARLGYSNHTPAKEPYRRAYTAEMIDRVAKQYAVDLELFGYSFDGPSDGSEVNTPHSTTVP